MRLHLVCMFGLAASALEAQASRSVRGVIIDPASHTPISGALVEINNAATGSSARSDEAGEFRFDLPAGTYQLVVRRIGYGPATKQITVADRPVETTVELHATAQKLAAVRVGAHGSGIYGVVESGLLNRPMPYAEVKLAGAKLETLTDSVGSFFFDVAPGRYVIRIGRKGYASELFTVDVAKDQVVDASTILERSDGDEAPGRAGLWEDFDQRLRWANMNAALMSGAEMRKASANLLDAIMGSPAFIHQGMRLGSTVCVFIDGIPKPNLPVEVYRLDHVQAVEVYGHGGFGSGDPSHFMENDWPAGAPCSGIDRQLPQPLGKGQDDRSTVHWVGIWTRK